MQCFIINSNHPLYNLYIEDIYQLRHKVFKEKLGWDVKTVDGNKEIDDFDLIDNLHYIIVLEREKLLGCIRLLPTESEYMIEKVFPELLDEIPKSKDLWEGSRFAVLPEYKKTYNHESNRVGLLLLKGMYDFGVENNIDYLVATTDHINSFLKIAGLSTEIIGNSLQTEHVKVIAVKIDIKQSYESIAA